MSRSQNIKFSRVLDLPGKEIDGVLVNTKPSYETEAHEVIKSIEGTLKYHEKCFAIKVTKIDIKV